MSGFFDRMAARAAGSEPRWQVRPRARFERADPGTGLWESEAEDPRTPQPETASQRPERALVGRMREERGTGPTDDWVSRRSDEAPLVGEVASVPAASPIASPEPGTPVESAPVTSVSLAGVRGPSPPEDPSPQLAETNRPAAPLHPIPRPAAAEERRSPVSDEAAGRPARSSFSPYAVEEPNRAHPSSQRRRSSRARREALPQPDDRDVSGPNAAGAAIPPSTGTVLRGHLLPALRDQGLLSHDERAELVELDDSAAAPPAPAAGTTAVVVREADTTRSTEGGVHVHIDRVQIVRSAPDRPSPTPAAPNGPSRLEAYLERRRETRR